MIILKGQVPHTTQLHKTLTQKKKLVEKEIQQKKAKYASMKQGKAKGCTKLSVISWGEGEGVLNKFLYGEVLSEVQPLTLLYTTFHEKGTPFVTSVDKWYLFYIPSLELCIPCIVI